VHSLTTASLSESFHTANKKNGPHRGICNFCGESADASGAALALTFVMFPNAQGTGAAGVQKTFGQFVSACRGQWIHSWSLFHVGQFPGFTASASPAMVDP